MAGYPCRCPRFRWQMRLQILDIGETSYRLLASEQRGVILAVVSGAVYLVSDSGELLWLTIADAPRHPRGIRISAPLPPLAVNTPFTGNERGLLIGPDTVLDGRAAAIWSLPSLSARDVLPFIAVPERVRIAFSVLNLLPPPAGLGRLLPEIAGIATKGRLSFRIEDLAPSAVLALPIIQNIAAASLAHRGEEVLSLTEALVGLGEGLTPSGDDFVGGMLFCFYWLSRLYGNFPAFDRADVTHRLSGKTNPISAAVLNDLANGRGVEPLHQWLSCILTGRPADQVQQHAARLVRIGHSTGWDLLSGALTGLLWTFS